MLEQELKARLYHDYEYDSVNGLGNRIYKINVGGFKIEQYLNQEYPSGKDRLIAIFKGDLKEDFDLGYVHFEIDEDVDE